MGEKDRTTEVEKLLRKWSKVRFQEAF